MATTAVVIDDSAEYLNMIQTALGSLGWETHVCLTGTSGLEKIMEVKPDLIITDINLPDTDGFSICKKVRQEPSLGNVKVLMITGSFKKDEDRLRASKLGADEYLLKPFRISDLLVRVRKLIP